MIDLENILINNNCIIISHNELKPFFLDLKCSKPELNFKFITISDIKQNLFGIVNEQAIKIGMNLLGENYSVIKKYLSYIKSGVNINVNSKIKTLYDILIDNNLIYIEKNYDLIFKNKLVIFLGFIKDDIEITHIIEKLKITNFTFISLNELFVEREFYVHDYLRVDEEIHDAFLRVIELLNSGIKPNQIEIVTDYKKNYFFLDTYSKLLNLHLNFIDKKSLYDTKTAKLIEKDIEIITSNSIDSYNDNSYEFQLIKKYLDFYDFYNMKNKIVNYKEILQDAYLNDYDDIEGIKVTNKFYFNPKKHIILIGFDNSFFTKIIRNNDFFDDNIKILNNLNSSEILNIEYNELLKCYLFANKNLELFFGEVDGENKEEISYYLSFIYNKKDIMKKHLVGKLSYHYDYSKSLALNYYSYYSELANIYKQKTIEYYIYDQYFKQLKKFDNTFKQIRPLKIENYEMSYTQLNSFFNCPFKFYLERILKIINFETNFYLNAGSLIHKILEKVYDNNFEFDKVYENILNSGDFIFSNKELILLDKLKLSTKVICDRLIKEKNTSSIFDTKSELDFNVPTTDPNFILTGKIDSLLLAKNEFQNSVQIIDYKTSENLFQPKLNRYGLNLQLPIYSYLIEKSPRFANYPIEGIFYISFLTNNLFDYYNLNINKINSFSLKSGAFSSSIDNLKLFEPKITDYLDSKTIQGLSIKKDGNLDSKKTFIFNFSKPIIINGKEYPSLIDQNIKIFINYLNNSKFPISPFCSNKHNACRYCSYKDICFKRKKDERRDKELEKIYLDFNDVEEASHEKN